MKLEMIQISVTSNWIFNTERPNIIWIKETSVINNIIKVIGYHTYIPSQGPNLGSALLIKGSFPHTQLKTNLNSFLAIIIYITSSPNTLPLEKTLTLALKNYMPLFFLRDLNPHHPRFGASSTNISSIHLLQILHTCNLECGGGNLGSCLGGPGC